MNLNHMKRAAETNSINSPAAISEISLKDMPFVQQLTENELMMLELNSVLKLYKKNRIIYDEGNRHAGIFVVLEGIVKIYKIGSNGKQ